MRVCALMIAVNPSHSCGAAVLQRSQFEQFSHPMCDPFPSSLFLSPYHASLRANEIPRNELLVSISSPSAFPRAIFPVSLALLVLSTAPLLSPERILHSPISLSRRVLESVREETRTIFALGKDCSNRRFARHSVGNCAKLGPNVSQGLSRLATSHTQDFCRHYGNENISPFNFTVVIFQNKC